MIKDNVENILCVGVFGNENTYILAALIHKIILNTSLSTRFFIKCAGIKEESVREYPPCKSFYEAMNGLGFFPSREASHPKIRRDAELQKLIPIEWNPTPIQSIPKIEMTDVFMTPYRSVFEELKSKEYVREKKLLLVCDSNGIGLDCCPSDAAKKMLPWVLNYFTVPQQLSAENKVFSASFILQKIF